MKKCWRAPLHLASGYGKFEIANLLLERGANINEKEKFGRTPLHLASEYGHFEIANLLLERGENE